jgi:hypothetical protein
VELAMSMVPPGSLRRGAEYLIPAGTSHCSD